MFSRATSENAHHKAESFHKRGPYKIINKTCETRTNTSLTHNPPDTNTCRLCSDLPWSGVCCEQRSPGCYNVWGSARSVWGLNGSSNKAAGWTASGRSCSAGRGQTGWCRSWWRPGYELQHCTRSEPWRCPPGGKNRILMDTDFKSTLTSFNTEHQHITQIIHDYSLCYKLQWIGLPGSNDKSGISRWRGWEASKQRRDQQTQGLS